MARKTNSSFILAEGEKEAARAAKRAAKDAEKEESAAFWEDKVHCYYLFLKESQIESHL